MFNNLFQMLVVSIKAKFMAIISKLRMLTDINYIRARISGFFRMFFSSILNVRPRHNKDYYGIFGWLVSKKLVMAITIIVGVVSLYFIFVLNPPQMFSKSETGIRTYDYDSIPLRFVSGNVKILAKSKYLAYEGNVKKGEVTGNGKLYRKDGSVVYIGEFDNNKFNGNGTTYYPSGDIQYVGEFVDNLYQGKGKLFRENGSLEYEGDFNNNKKDGAGELYDSSGNAIYKGDFNDGNILFTNFLGKSTQKLAQIYLGDKTIYTGGEDFVVHMKSIDAIYYGNSSTDNLENSITVDGVYVLKDYFEYTDKNYASIYDVKKDFGAPIYSGNTYVTMPDAIAIHVLNLNGNEFFGDVEGEWVETLEDVVTVNSYDMSYMFYMYTFVKDDIRYNFYCKDRSGQFEMYSMEKDE